MRADQPALGTGIEVTAGESRHGYVAGNIAFATIGIGRIVMPPAPPAGLTRAAEFDNCLGATPKLKAAVCVPARRTWRRFA